MLTSTRPIPLKIVTARRRPHGPGCGDVMREVEFRLAALAATGKRSTIDLCRRNLRPVEYGLLRLALAPGRVSAMVAALRAARDDLSWRVVGDPLPRPGRPSRRRDRGGFRDRGHRDRLCSRDCRQHRQGRRPVPPAATRHPTESPTAGARGLWRTSRIRRERARFGTRPLPVGRPPSAFRQDVFTRQQRGGHDDCLRTETSNSSTLGCGRSDGRDERATACVCRRWRHILAVRCRPERLPRSR
jgi:hypothetical protein